jgi:hypothetical protein
MKFRLQESALFQCRTGPIRWPRNPALVYSLALIIPALVATPLEAEAHRREHILLARQVGVSVYPPWDQRVVVLIANPPHTAEALPPCRFSGVVRADEVTPAFGSGLSNLLFEPVALAPGESVAIEVPPLDPDTSVAPSQVRVLILGIAADRPAVGPCGLQVAAFGYNGGSQATEVAIGHRFIAGLEKTFAAPDPVNSPLPLGLVGGNANQTAHLILIEDRDSPPYPRCDFSGVVVAETIPPLIAEDSTAASHPIREAWPVKWEISDTKSAAVVEIPLDALGAGVDRRIDATLSLQFDQPLPAACRMRIGGSLQISDETGGIRSVIPLGEGLPAHGLAHVAQQ